MNAIIAVRYNKFLRAIKEKKKSSSFSDKKNIISNHISARETYRITYTMI